MGCTLQGEGEVKILDRLRQPWAGSSGGGSHVIVGGDADIVLMALMGGGLISHTPSIYVMSDVREFPSAPGR